MEKLFLLKPQFQDPDYPGQTFFCWHCALMEGVLKMYPQLLQKIEIHRIEWPRPRTELISEVGPENQSLPLLILGQGKDSIHQTGSLQGRSFIANKDSILSYFSEEYGIPQVHP